MKVVDLADSFEDYSDLWYTVISSISKSNDRLKNNYINIDPRDYVCFTALINDNKIICFSALESDPIKWGDKIVRCSSRMWIHPDYRFKGAVRFTRGSKFLNSYYCLPVQLDAAKALGYDCVFMSRDKNKKAFESWNQLVNNNCKSDFRLLDQKYDLGGGSVQMVSIDESQPNALDLWNFNMQKNLIKDLVLDSTVY